MTIKTKSDNAIVASKIRAYLKEKGIEGKVRSSSSGGSSVSVYVEDLCPRIFQELELYAKQFKAGYFDSNDGSYRFHQHHSGPSVMYMSVNNHFSDNVKQSVFTTLRNGLYAEHMASLNPILKNNHSYTYVNGEDLVRIIHCTLIGFHTDEAQAFWGKDQVKREINNYRFNGTELVILKEDDLTMPPIMAKNFVAMSSAIS